MLFLRFRGQSTTQCFETADSNFDASHSEATDFNVFQSHRMTLRAKDAVLVSAVRCLIALIFGDLVRSSGSNPQNQTSKMSGAWWFLLCLGSFQRPMASDNKLFSRSCQSHLRCLLLQAHPRMWCLGRGSL